METYLRGRIHFTDITENYKKDQNLSLEKKTNENELKITTDPSAEKEFKMYDPDDWQVEISDDSAIYGSDPSQNDFSAIAAVDYAMRETKPSCGLVKELKVISTEINSVYFKIQSKIRKFNK